MFHLVDIDSIVSRLLKKNQDFKYNFEQIDFKGKKNWSIVTDISDTKYAKLIFLETIEETWYNFVFIIYTDLSIKRVNWQGKKCTNSSREYHIEFSNARFKKKPLHAITRLINHWSMNWAQFKDPVSHMCLAGAVLASWSLREAVAGSSPFAVMTNIFVTEFTELNETFRKSSSVIVWFTETCVHSHLIIF